MKKTLLVLIIAIVGLILVSSRDQENIVTLNNNGFSPLVLRVHLGEAVTFRNETIEPFWPASNLHPTHEIYPEFDPKRQIGKGETWSFTFDKASRWTYHDHLHQNFTGTIEVLDSYGTSDNKAPKSLKDCTQTEENLKQRCWDELLTYTIRHKGLDTAFKLFAELYETDPSIPKGCHGWSHILGKEAYELFKKKKRFVLRPETSYCGYGFFHGFIERLIQDSGDIKKTKEFCEYAAKQLDDSGEVYANCIHGIGHGSVNIDDPSLWGDFDAMLAPGLKNCEAILSTDDDLQTCWEGAFNAMTLNKGDGLYGLSLDTNDLTNFFEDCQRQTEEYRRACYFEFMGYLPSVTNHNFKKAARMLLNENLSEEGEVYLIFKMMGDFMQDDIAKESQVENVANCRVLPEHLYVSCYRGIISGFIGHGDPEKAYVKGLAFCEDKILTDEERGLCYKHIVSATVPRNSDVCKTVPTVYQKLCQTN